MCSVSWTAPPGATSVRCVLEEQKLCKPLPETAHHVGQVIMQTKGCRARSCNIWVEYEWKQLSIQVTSGFEQVCTRPPIRLCVRSAAVASFRSTGARRAVIFAQRTITARWALCRTVFNKRHLCCSCYICPVTKNVVPHQSPDVNPILCPSDAFCPPGSFAPSYCMETFFRKAGDTCEFAPVTIALLVISGGGT